VRAVDDQLEGLGPVFRERRGGEISDDIRCDERLAQYSGLWVKRSHKHTVLSSVLLQGPTGASAVTKE
jgi:hypothetical protein